MADLQPSSPLGHMRPVQIGTSLLTEVVPESVHAILPFPGQMPAASRMLAAQLGAGFPQPGRSAVGHGDLRLLWAGREQAFAVGPMPDEVSAHLAQHAAVADVSAAWVVLRLSGPDTEEVLARLTPLDLHRDVFRVGHTARTEVQHMTALLVRMPSAIEIWGMRSMAETLRHDLIRAMRSVAARATRGG